MVESFSSFAKQEPLFPDSERIENKLLIGKDFVIKKAEFLPSSFGGEFAVFLLELNGKEYSTSLGSKAVLDQLKKYKDKLPFKTTLKEIKSKDGRMYMTLA